MTLILGSITSEISIATITKALLKITPEIVVLDLVNYHSIQSYHVTNTEQVSLFSNGKDVSTDILASLKNELLPLVSVVVLTVKQAIVLATEIDGDQTIIVQAIQGLGPKSVFIWSDSSVAKPNSHVLYTDQKSYEFTLKFGPQNPLSVSSIVAST